MSGLRLIQVAQPDAPATLKGQLWFDSTSKRLQFIDEYGAVRVLEDAGQRSENLLINGGFQFAQRQAPGTLTTYSNTTGRSYGADRWGLTNENASVQYQRVDTSAAVETGLGARYYGKVKKITNAGKMIVSQVVEGSQAFAMRGRTLRFQCKLRYTVAASMTVRLGLLALGSAGTLDSLPATFASAFGAAGTDPTWGTNLAAITPSIADGGTISGAGVTCVLTSAWARYSGTFVVPAGTKNLVAVIWTNGQPAANDELNIAEAGLYDGAEIRDWLPRPLAQEFELCQRYYAKTFLLDTAPAQNAGVNTGEHRFIAGKAGAAAEFSDEWRFPVAMRTTPATLTLYNTSAANAQVRDVTAAADCSASAAAGATESSVAVTATGNAGTAVGNLLSVHIAADAEL